MKTYGPVKISNKLLNLMENWKIVKSDYRLSKISCYCIEKRATKLLAETRDLAKEYGQNYPAQILVNFNNTDLCSHVAASEIGIDKKFQYKDNTYTRLPNPFGPDVVHGSIGAKDDDGNLLLIAADEIVRPLLNGYILKTPEEIEADDDLDIKRDIAYSNIDNRVGEFIKTKSGMLDCVVSYSAYKSDKNDIPIDNLDEIAVHGKVIFECDTYQSPVAENPTWLDVCLFAEYMIRETEDYHHVFLEGVHITDRMFDGVPVYGFNMGS